MMKTLSFFMFAVLVHSSFSDGARRSKGLVVCRSNQDFKSTRRTLLRSISKEPDTVFFEEVDFQAGAKDGGKTILPNTLVVFGNPSLEARFMEEKRQLAVDLPKKIQIWEDEKGNVFIAYSPSEYLEERYGGVDAVQHVLDELSALYGRLAATTADRNNCNIESHPVTGHNQIQEGQSLMTKRSDFNFNVSVNMPDYIAFRHDMSDVNEIIDGLDDVFKDIAVFATKDSNTDKK